MVYTDWDTTSETKKPFAAELVIRKLNQLNSGKLLNRKTSKQMKTNASRQFHKFRNKSHIPLDQGGVVRNHLLLACLVSSIHRYTRAPTSCQEDDSDP
ncbi:hypothetical protein CSKR_101614 [Clonorchis sinensis]|uniref:Uncharacterized protein n=1 Tax=Clonorchis sinensis TaxID=79923 RepID=A0A3R7H6D3_CLOSI|nr:hypothetical protein CSKR_101614 [Clonorchis sinensis]